MSAGADPIDAVVTHHLNTFASGVARFNEILAERLEVPLLGIEDDRVSSCRRPCLSFKFSELRPEAAERLARMAEEQGPGYDLLLHDIAGTELETRMIAGATEVWCANAEIEAEVRRHRAQVGSVWTPSLLLDDRTYPPVKLSVFSFGMAHKIQTARFAHLRDLLEATGHLYALYVSSANHETASIKDGQAVFEEMHELFPPERLYFLGNLSDVAIFNFLRETTFFASFFPSGVRANNTTVSAAMEQGSVVITNMDEHSPPHFGHMDNLIDIERCDELPEDPLDLTRIGVRAMETARSHGWDDLVSVMRGAPAPAAGTNATAAGG